LTIKITILPNVFNFKVYNYILITKCKNIVDIDCLMYDTCSGATRTYFIRGLQYCLKKRVNEGEYHVNTYILAGLVSQALG